MKPSPKPTEGRLNDVAQLLPYSLAATGRMTIDQRLLIGENNMQL